MTGDEVPTADVALYLDLLAAPVSRWSQTESDDEQEGLWLQLCLVILEDIPGEVVQWLRAVDPPQHALPSSALPIDAPGIATDLLTLLRVGQKYWGVGVPAGKNLGEIGAWAGNLDTGATVSALGQVTHLVRERRPTLETELFRHATRRAARRIDSWLGSVSAGDADVLVKRYGLRGQRRATLAEVGESRSVSRARIQQIESRALRRLGPRVADELRGPSKAGSRSEALERALQSLSTSPGKDVHRIDDLLNLASADETWWPCGIAMLSEDLQESTVLTERHFVREWLTHSTDAIWLDGREHFIRRRAENRNPYIGAARKLLAIHESVSIAVVHEALIDVWRSELWPECMLSVDWLAAFLRSSTLTVAGDSLVRTKPEISSEELSQSEQQLLGALRELGGVATLDELRARLPDLRRHGSTLSQTLYRRTPIVQRLGPSIFGIRGAAHDPERVAILEDRALREGHPWINRGGWKRDARRSLQYHIPSRQALQERIRLPNDIVDALIGDDERTGPLVWRTPDGVEHSVTVQVALAGTYLNGVRPILERLHASGGDTVEVTVHSDGVWAVSLNEEAPAEAVVIRMGRGWTSVAY